MKLNKPSPDDSAVTLLGIYPKELKAYVHTETCPLMFIAPIFMITKTWKQRRCLQFVKG
jgi:hypothetical protein